MKTNDQLPIRQVTVDAIDQHRWQSPYILSKEAAAAVNLALTLGKPLLLSGEPGTGKTTLAERVAEELGFGEVLQFNTKSSSQAIDLFYRFDSVRRFGETQLSVTLEKEELPHPTRFLTLAALGKAIAFTFTEDKYVEVFRQKPTPELDLPRRSVVLIDEVDKAPRDFPNDLLHEIDQLEFSIPDIDHPDPIRVPRAQGRRTPDPRRAPLILLTTNRENQLPEAFLRRCLYLHLAFPKPSELNHIVARHLAKLDDSSGNQGASTSLTTWISWILKVRENPEIIKKSSTAEIIDSARALRELGWNWHWDTAIPKELREQVLSTLFKTQQDVEIARAALP